MNSLWRTVDRGTLRDIALVCLADAIVAAAFGAISVSGGLPVWVPVAMSLLVFAGGAQFAAIGVVLAGGGPVAAVAAAMVLNGRLLPFGFAVADVLNGRWWTRLIGAHLMTDEAVAFVLRHDDPRKRRAVYWTVGLALFTVWNVAVVLGALGGRGIADTDALGLDAAFPAVLLALVLPSLADKRTRVAALIGAVVAVAATPFLPAGVPVLLALVGLVPSILSRTGRKRPGEAARPDEIPETGAATEAGTATRTDSTQETC
ncbi:AzlC family ABC transporter permease [Sphaerisporangium corydalis]|uniref:AzlC family ABC transporter permease n=1 Tax=Sphaerisporangium corydalis TaxID=1441875 RepID=A0ABV9E5W3_9ACTN|nr:AzlC family ABC transporter permease [Sphaerisporangium corydalis]